MANKLANCSTVLCLREAIKKKMSQSSENVPTSEDPPLPTKLRTPYMVKIKCCCNQIYIHCNKFLTKLVFSLLVT